MQQAELTAILHAASIFVNIDHVQIRANLDAEIRDAEKRLETLVAARASIAAIMDDEADNPPATTFKPTIVEKPKRQGLNNLPKFNRKQGDEIRAKLAQGITAAALAKEYRVSPATISNVKRMKAGI